MTLTVAEPYGPASEAAVLAVEEALGVTLPPAYRRWQLAVGGGELDRDEVIPGTDGDGYIGELDPVDALPRYQDLEGTSNVPREYLVVSLGGGGCLAVRISGGDEGSVWWADTGAAGRYPVGEPVEGIMARLADDFDAFLELFDDGS